MPKSVMGASGGYQMNTELLDRGTMDDDEAIGEESRSVLEEDRAGKLTQFEDESLIADEVTGFVFDE